MGTHEKYELGGCIVYINGFADIQTSDDETLQSTESEKYKQKVLDSVKKTVAILEEAGIELHKPDSSNVGIFFGYGEQDKVFALTDILDYLNRCMEKLGFLIKLENVKNESNKE